MSISPAHRNAIIIANECSYSKVLEAQRFARLLRITIAKSEPITPTKCDRDLRGWRAFFVMHEVFDDSVTVDVEIAPRVDVSEEGILEVWGSGS